MYAASLPMAESYRKARSGCGGGEGAGVRWASWRMRCVVNPRRASASEILWLEADEEVCEDAVVGRSHPASSRQARRLRQMRFIVFAELYPPDTRRRAEEIG
jgi:hypothetical protein